MKSDFGRIGKFLGIGLFSVLVSFLLLNLAMVEPVIAIDCRQSAIEQGCGENDQTCIIDYCTSEASLHLLGEFDNKSKDDNIDDTEEADKEDDVDEDPKCEYVGSFSSSPPLSMFCHEEEDEWEWED